MIIEKGLSLYHKVILDSVILKLCQRKIREFWLGYRYGFILTNIELLDGVLYQKEDYLLKCLCNSVGYSFYSNGIQIPNTKVPDDIISTFKDLKPLTELTPSVYCRNGDWWCVAYKIPNSTLNLVFYHKMRSFVKIDLGKVL